MVIVDSSVWIDYLADRSTAQVEWLNREIGNSEIGLTDLILCEVLQGLRTDAEFERVRTELCRFQILQNTGTDLAASAARNYRFLRGQGITVRSTIDCLVATVCLTHGHALLHRDKDFGGFEQHLGLETVRTIHA